MPYLFIFPNENETAEGKMLMNIASILAKHHIVPSLDLLNYKVQIRLDQEMKMA